MAAVSLDQTTYGLFSVASGNGQQQTERNHCHQFMEAEVHKVHMHDSREAVRQCSDSQEIA
jgi:hypothetical protein